MLFVLAHLLKPRWKTFLIRTMLQLLIAVSQGQSATEYQVKEVFLFNFAK